jgi:hypothetical protein
VTGTIIDKVFYDGEFYGNFQNLRCGYFVSGGQYVPKKQTPGVFDMDSTLIQTEVIDELAELG